MESASKLAEPAPRAESTRSKRPRVDATVDVPTSPSLTAISTDASSATPSPAAIACRAYELFLERGGEHEHDLDDWLRAERELSAPEQEATLLTREFHATPAN